ncbi:MAG: ABC transporter permease [Thermoleophilia bacterium]
MIAFALKGLAARKLRASLTALAVVLGVAMVSGSYVLTDTIKSAFDEIFSTSYAGTDAVVTGRDLRIGSGGERTAPPPIPESLLATVRSLPEVALASGLVFESRGVKIVKPDGSVVNTRGAPSLGFGLDTSPSYARFNPLRLVAGRWPRGAGEAVIDAGTARRIGLGVGDRVRIATLHPARPFRLVGIARYGDVDSLGAATFVVFDLRTAQALLDRRGKLDAISVAAKTGVSPKDLVAALERVLPPGIVARTGQQQAAEQKRDVADFTTFIRYFLLAFAGIALFVGAFVIFNTLSITVAQRARELATLRTIGASRLQVLWSVVAEALAIGLVSSLAGLFLGLALAKGLDSLFVSLGIEFPRKGLVLAPRTVLVSLVLGVLVTLIAGLAPAVRATRVPPIAAVREGAVLPPSRLARLAPAIALLVIVAAVGLLVRSLFADDQGVAERLLSMGSGCLLLFGGVALLSSRFVRPLVGLVGWPGARLGGAPGRLAQENARRNPGRTAATAAALMIGLALVTFVAVVAQGMRASNRDAIERQVKATFVVTSQDGFTPFAAGAGEVVSRLAGVRATSVRADQARVAGSDKYVTGIDPATILQAYKFEWEQGSDAVLAELGRNGAIVERAFAKDKGLRIGSRLTLLAPTGRRISLRVAGVYKPPPFYPLLGYVSIPVQTFDALFDRPRNQYTFISGKISARRLKRALAEFPDTRVLTREEWIADAEANLSQFLNLLYVLLALSVVVSLLGIVNTLVLSVLERRRELGMLRAVGMTRGQVRRMVRHESVVTALIGAVLGLPLGIFLAALVTAALSRYALQFSVPVGSLALFAAIALLAGVAAAVLPARRAARLDVLQALQYE